MTLTTFVNFTRWFALITSFMSFGFVAGGVCATLNPTLILALVIILHANVLLLRWGTDEWPL